MKILFLDIETKPAVAYIWRMFRENIGTEQLIESGGVICFGAKFSDSNDKFFFSDWDDGHDKMVQAAHDLISEADAVVTYNGDSFDLPKLNGEFLMLKLPPVPPVTSIDVYKTIKKMGFQSGKLAFVGPHLSLGEKIKHEGFGLWRDVLAGEKSAQRKMTRYCLQDVLLLEKLYNRVKPYIKNHPFIGDRGCCGACNGKVLHSRGYRRTKSFKIQRLQCQQCGSWQDGKREKING